MDTNTFWERQPGEPDTAYNAFCCYRDMGITRSLRKAAAKFYAGDRTETTGSPESGTSGQVARFKEWSRRWLWVSRCEAFDAEEARERSLRLRERRIRMSEFHYSLGQLALQRVAEQLRLMGPGEPMPKSLAAVMNAAADLQRLAVGSPTAIEDVRGTVRPPEEDRDDAWLQGLSLEEKEELVRLAGLMESTDDLPEDQPQ